MLSASLLMLGLGFVAAAGLALASKIFYVEQDPRIDEVADALPGANCGGCGFPGCGAMAEAIVKGIAPVDGCVAGSMETYTAIGAIMGVKIEAKEPTYAERYCQSNYRADKIFNYNGAMSCKAAAEFYDGDSACTIGCLGYGSCEAVCKFDAIRMGDDGYPRFNAEACKSCGACVEACPHDVVKLRSMSTKLVHLNTIDECLAPCRQSCPAEINIPAYIEAAAEGDYDKALQIIKERNPLPSVCGRVCPAPCEDTCRRTVIEDDAVFHNTIKRYIADQERLDGKRVELPKLPDSGKTVAVVGGGPAGLTAAYFLRRLGHSVTIYENEDHLGGMLRYGIPEYRLPKKILDWDINGVLELGVEAKTGVKLGKDVNLAGLESDYDAVVIAVGAWINSTMRTEGEDMEGVWGGINFLAKREQGEKVNLGKRVAIIGGGNTAIDASRSALREGAEEVTLIYRRTEKEMPANPVEVHAAKEEGVNFMFLTAPTKVIGENNKMTGLEVIEMELGEPDASGRRRPVPKEGSEKVIELDAVIAAIGQKVSADFVTEELKEKGLVVTRWGTLDGNPDTLQTGIPKIFCAGDGFTGPGLAVEAIGSGRRAARAVHQFLNGEEITVPQNVQRKRVKDSLIAALKDVAPQKRVSFPELDPHTRIRNYEEVDQTISEEDLKREAYRCLRCGTVCYSTDGERSGKTQTVFDFLSRQ